MIIAVDGPAAAGKGTLARRLAQHFGYHFLDTGLLYRMTAKALIDRGATAADEAAAAAAAAGLRPTSFDEASLRNETVGEMASAVAVIPAVRAALLSYQRAFAAKPPGAVLDGRDIGTVVCPGADVKFFVTASPEVRARRRLLELQETGAAQPYEEVLASIHARDARDSRRAVSPLIPAADAIVLDTSQMSAGEALEAAVKAIANPTSPFMGEADA
jgi:CMP/dCMP kinase